MKISSYGIIAVFLVVIAVALAGCTFNKTFGTTSSLGTTTTSSGSSGSASSSGQAASASATAATCPAVTAATSWTGKWNAGFDTAVCKDLRPAFYPATTDNPDPWTDMIAPNGNRAMSITFTQTGCAVTGSGIITRHGCPITYTGTVDSTGALSGTWKAYCDLTFGSSSTHGSPTADNGVFNLNMEPGGSTFIGEMSLTDPDLIQAKAKDCPNGNSNFVGKRG